MKNARMLLLMSIPPIPIQQQHHEAHLYAAMQRSQGTQHKIYTALCILWPSQSVFTSVLLAGFIN